MTNNKPSPKIIFFFKALITLILFGSLFLCSQMAPDNQVSQTQRDSFATTDNPCPAPLQIVYIDNVVAEDNKIVQFTVLFPTTGRNWYKETFENIDLSGMSVNPIPFNYMIKNRLPVCLIVSNRYSRNASLFVPTTSNLPKE